MSLENVRSLNCFVLGDQVLWLNKLSAWLSGSGGCFDSKDVLFEEALLDVLFKVLSESPAVDGSVFYCHGRSNILLL